MAGALIPSLSGYCRHRKSMFQPKEKLYVRSYADQRSGHRTARNLDISRALVKTTLPANQYRQVLEKHKSASVTNVKELDQITAEENYASQFDMTYPFLTRRARWVTMACEP